MRKRPDSSRPYADDADRHVGDRIHSRRVALGLTQAQLAATLGLSHRQLQQFEASIHRVTAGQLFEIARALGVDIEFFFRGLSSRPYLPLEVKQAQDASPHLEGLARDFLRIANPQYQEALCRLAKALADRAGVDKPGS